MENGFPAKPLCERYLVRELDRIFRGGPSTDQ